jgi:hypothetical protein
MSVDAQGVADLAVLDAFNQPIGNLNHMHAPFDAIRKLMEPGAPPVVAPGNNSLIELSRTDDIEWLKVHYEDKDAFIERDTTVMLEELQSLIDDAKAFVT